MIQKTSRSEAYYIDSFAQGSQHEMFNSSLMMMCGYVFDSVKCNISESGYEAFKNITNASTSSNISFNKIYVVRGQSKLSLIWRYLISSLQNIRYLLASPKNSIVIFPFNNLFSLKLLNAINKLLKRRIVIFCHGEMEGLINEKKNKGLLHAKLIKLVKSFFLNPKTKISDTIFFSVLGNALRDNLSEILSENKISKFIIIDHPYIFKHIQPEQGTTIDKYNVGTVGTLTKLKGLDSLASFVTNLPSHIRSKVAVSVIGSVPNDITILKNLQVQVPSVSKMLSREEYNLKIQNLDLILFFYPINSYKITASAAVYDAILHEKPVLALSNDYFSYLFKKFGDFGYLCNSVEEMTNTVSNLMQHQNRTKFDFSALKQKLTPEILSTQLASELARIGFLP